MNAITFKANVDLLVGYASSHSCIIFADFFGFKNLGAGLLHKKIKIKTC